MVYKQYYQRWYRHKHNKYYEEMKNISEELVHAFYFCRNDKSKYEESRLMAINLAEKLLFMEEEIDTNTKFSFKLLESLKSKDFEINVTYPVERLWKSTNITGKVYIITADTMPHCSKLGAVTMDLEARLRNYTSRYRYDVSLFYSIEIVSPFYFENHIAALISHKRVSGKSPGHTNEWFYISPVELQKIIEDNIKFFLNAIPS